MADEDLYRKFKLSIFFYDVFILFFCVRFIFILYYYLKFYFFILTHIFSLISFQSKYNSDTQSFSNSRKINLSYDTNITLKNSFFFFLEKWMMNTMFTYWHSHNDNMWLRAHKNTIKLRQTPWFDGYKTRDTTRMMTCPLL